jgi:hypothetical protein
MRTRVLWIAVMTAGRDCMVIFRAIPTTGNHLTSYNDCGTRWEFAARLSAGKNHLTSPKLDYAENHWKAVSTLEIYMYEPRPGESITVDNIRLSSEPPKSTSAYNTQTQRPKEGFRVAGTDLVVKNADDLGEQLKLKDTSRKPEARTVEQWEADIRRQFDEIKRSHPRAVLAMLRQGQKGYDAAHPAENSWAGSAATAPRTWEWLWP